jgi:hypothetical protein
VLASGGTRRRAQWQHSHALRRVGAYALHTYGSRHCVSASSPVAAVTSRGTPTVSSGSTTASAGSMKLLRMLAFTFASGESNTLFFVTCVRNVRA